jgi:ferric iron reductase protein FhuF
VKAGRDAIDVKATIDQVTVGEYVCFAGGLVGQDDPRTSVPADALLDDAMRARIEARFAARFDHFDPRAVHSIWMKWYLNIFMPPLLLSDLFLMRSLPVEIDRISFIVGDDTRVTAVKLGDIGEDTSRADPFGRFQRLIFAHFDPLIEIWSTRTEVTRRVFWSNVGNTFEAMLRRVETVSGPSERLQQARQLLREPIWSDGRPNPLYDAVFDVIEAGVPERRRRVCCLQYLLPDRRFCKACPVEEARAPAANRIPSID